MKIIYLLLFSLIACSSSKKISSVDLIKNHTRDQHEAFSEKIMITSQGKESTKAGIKMIELGGNAFDAAAAVSFVISVERPQSTGIGGGGFMLLDGPEFKNGPTSLDFREMAPIRANSRMYLNKNSSIIKGKSINGHFSSGVPGTVMGVLTMQAKYGKLTRKQVMQPAIDLANNGFKIYPHLAKALKFRSNILKKYPASAKIFLKNNEPLKLGDILIQKDLAKTLQTISNVGINGFYKGWVADAIYKEYEKYNNYISKADLLNYKAKWRKPISNSYKDYQVFSMAPPSSGGTHIIQILNTLEPLNLLSTGVQTVETIHKTATAMQLAFVDRARYMADTDFVKVPIKGLTSKKYSKSLTDKITTKALKLEPKDLNDPNKYESDETTHFTIIDNLGNVVSSTQTINYWMGSGVVIPATGIVMNDEMDDFSKKAGDSNLFGAIGSKNNLVQPGKRPLSSMSPTIIKKDGKTILSLGSPAGTKILTCVTQVILNYLEHKLSLWDSVAATRYHHQWRPDEIRIEESSFPENIINQLKAKGHKINIDNLGCRIQAIAVEENKLHGVSDPRGEGLAKGI